MMSGHSVMSNMSQPELENLDRRTTEIFLLMFVEIPAPASKKSKMLNVKYKRTDALSLWH